MVIDSGAAVLSVYLANQLIRFVTIQLQLWRKERLAQQRDATLLALANACEPAAMIEQSHPDGYSIRMSHA